MYTGFNLTFNEKSPYGAQLVRQYGGGEKYQARKKGAREHISRYLKNGAIDARKLQEAWFQSVNSDVFISHSHADEEVAIALAEVLEVKLGLRCFVDSCVWGNAEALLKEIDNEYCRRPSGDVYDYDRRNQSTSHVHMMLQGALAKMIDRTECIIFLNTPRSMVTDDELRNESLTGSPWIYSEVLTTRLIEKQRPKRPLKTYLRESLESEKMAMDSMPPFYHDLDLSHLEKLSMTDFSKWLSTNTRGEAALDALYEFKRV